MSHEAALLVCEVEKLEGELSFFLETCKGQSPYQGRSPFGRYLVPAGQSPASHPAAKPYCVLLRTASAPGFVLDSSEVALMRRPCTITALSDAALHVQRGHDY